MIRLDLSILLRYEITNQACDFIFNIHAAQTPQQTVVTESLEVSTPSLVPIVQTDTVSGMRIMRISANPGRLAIRYVATVDIDHHFELVNGIDEVPVSQLPTSVLPYLYPSRYCQSDQLGRLARREFGGLRRGYSRVQAIQDWVRLRTSFMSGSSNASTSAMDTLIQQVGVCRDFSHLMIALCRGVNIPARFVTGIDYGSDPAMGPTDFHAYVEVSGQPLVSV